MGPWCLSINVRRLLILYVRPNEVQAVRWWIGGRLGRHRGKPATAHPDVAANTFHLVTERSSSEIEQSISCTSRAFFTWWDFRLSLRWVWRWLSSRMLCGVACKTDVSSRSANGGRKHLWNVGQYLPNYMAQDPRRQPSSPFTCYFIYTSAEVLIYSSSFSEFTLINNDRANVLIRIVTK
jgi:hypothetical protein